MPLALLAILFLLTAFAYATVGFGGGSTYNALLVLSGADYRAIPAIALSCNILVVAGGVWHYKARGELRLKELLPFVTLSVPMAWLGGRVPIDERTFVGLLGLTLLASAALMLRSNPKPTAHDTLPVSDWTLGLPAGAGIGLLSGIVGIGGGIFLAPLLYLLGRKPARRIAGLASGFILVNSIAGLSGQLMKRGSDAPLEPWLASWPLFVAVVVGGQAGSRFGARLLSEQRMRQLTGVLVLYVSVRLLARWWELGT